MEKTQIKRMVIISIYLAIFVAFFWLIYFFTKAEESCFDGIRNQDEAGVDCGGICAKQCELKSKEDLKAIKAGFVESGISGKIDLFGVVSNPNQMLGSDSFDYKFNLKTSSGEIIAEKSGTGFILPGEKKYIIESGIEIKEIPTSVELGISNTSWKEINEFYEKPQLKIVNKNYALISSGSGFSEATGLLKNESLSDFASIKINIILLDEKKDVIALNSTAVNTVKSGEARDFKVAWPGRFTGEVRNIEILPEANVFDSESFAKRYFKPQSFR